ncbi:Uncharacterised protein [Bordetella pertussis]|nr:Uncharacterised protein [Bordetella pertussis]CFL93362.1 Uncharacterised protein [Bordetella pertussis]CFM44518.1 Uncharacterised protein [Bordetella pertussis]CFM98784.1 Uncharacterised protein [Bordetella pertussis]CFN20513.1 Uncharacterised protein [Bordetella pertussis]
MRAVAAGAGPRGRPREGARHGQQAGPRAVGQAQRRRRRRTDPGVLAVQPGRRGADVPGRGAVAHSRPRHPRCPDPRQDRARRLALAHGRIAVAVCQRRDLGPDDHRQAGRRQQRAVAVQGADAPDRQGRRAAGAQGREHGHAHDGRAVRLGPDDLRGPGQQPQDGGAGLSLLVRHAGRGRDHGRRRRTLLRGVRAGHPCHRQGGRRTRHLRRPGHLDQAVGAASALCARPARPGHGRAAAARQGADAAGAPIRYRPEHRRGGSRPARDFAGPAGSLVFRPRAGRLEWHRLRHPGLSEARAVRDRLRDRPGQAQPPPPDGAPGQGGVLGHGDQARPGRRPGGVSGLHAQGVHRRRLPGLRAQAAGGARGHIPAVRHP